MINTLIGISEKRILFTPITVQIVFLDVTTKQLNITPTKEMNNEQNEIILDLCTVRKEYKAYQA